MNKLGVQTTGNGTARFGGATNGEKQENGNKEKTKKQRKRVGVNPVLGNAGTMWEPSKKTPQLVSFLLSIELFLKYPSKH